MAEFYNEADHTDYPFKKGFNRGHVGGTLEDKGILDIQLTTGADTAFLAHINQAALIYFTIAAPDITFAISIQTVGVMEFTVELASPYGFATTANIVLSGKVVATGVLVTGDLSYFSTLADGEYYLDTPAVILPTLITSLRGAFVTEIIAANSPRRRPLDCCDEVDYGPLPPTPEVPPVFPIGVYQGIDNIIEFKEGFNCFITLSSNNSVMTIGSRIGAGAGVDTGEDPFLIDNWPFQSSTPYRCNDFISSVNGVQSTGNVLRLLAMGGLTFTSDPNNHKIVVTTNNQGAVCAD